MVIRNPQIIIVSSMGMTRGLIYDSIRSHPGLSTVEAIVTGRVYQIDGDIIERPGPRIVDGLEQVAKFIHPEIFGTPETRQ